MQKALGQHPLTLTAVSNLAVALHAAGLSEEALPLFKKALQVRCVMLLRFYVKEWHYI